MSRNAINDNKINNSSNIQSTGYYQTNSLILNNNIDVLIKPLVGEKNEYTPLNNNYLYQYLFLVYQELDH